MKKYKTPLLTDTNSVIKSTKEFLYMKAPNGSCPWGAIGGCVVIPKEIRRTMRIREGDPPDNSLTPPEKFAIAVHSILKRYNN